MIILKNVIEIFVFILVFCFSVHVCGFFLIDSSKVCDYCIGQKNVNDKMERSFAYFAVAKDLLKEGGEDVGVDNGVLSYLLPLLGINYYSQNLNNEIEGKTVYHDFFNNLAGNGCDLIPISNLNNFLPFDDKKSYFNWFLLLLAAKELLFDEVNIVFENMNENYQGCFKCQKRCQNEYCVDCEYCLGFMIKAFFKFSHLYTVFNKQIDRFLQMPIWRYCECQGACTARCCNVFFENHRDITESLKVLMGRRLMGVNEQWSHEIPVVSAVNVSEHQALRKVCTDLRGYSFFNIGGGRDDCFQEMLRDLGVFYIIFSEETIFKLHHVDDPLCPMLRAIGNALNDTFLFYSGINLRDREGGGGKLFDAIRNYDGTVVNLKNIFDIVSGFVKPAGCDVVSMKGFYDMADFKFEYLWREFKNRLPVYFQDLLPQEDCRKQNIVDIIRLDGFCFNDYLVLMFGALIRVYYEPKKYGVPEKYHERLHFFCKSLFEHFKDKKHLWPAFAATFYIYLGYDSM